MITCSKRTCTGRVYLDSDRCFNHQKAAGLWSAWFIFSALLGMGLMSFGIWVILVLLAWVTSK